MERFDPRRARLQSPDTFQRFSVTGDGRPLRATNLKPGEQLLVFERGGERRGLLQKQMIYHHLAQGEVAGEPYLVSF